MVSFASSIMKNIVFSARKSFELNSKSFLYFTLQLIINVYFTIYLQRLRVLISKPHLNVRKLWINVFRNMKYVGEIYNNWPNDLFAVSAYKTLKSSWEPLLTILQWSNTTSVISKWGTFSPFLFLFIFFGSF